MEVVKFIVENLNKAPFNKNLNVISFDSTSSEELFQILSDVLQNINNQPTIDVHTEDFETTTGRIFSVLHILRYKPFSSDMFTQKLMQGEKNTIYELLEWLLSNVDTLKQRAYLARFLIKIQIPNDILGKSDTAALHQQYIQLIEEFKKTHKENVSAKNVNKTPISELHSDGITMEKEKEIVSNRIYQMKKRVDNLTNTEQLLHNCHNLRLEQDRRNNIGWMLQEESLTVHQNQQRLFRITQQLQEMKKRSTGLSSQTLMKKLEEEITVTSYIVDQKLPRELNQQKKEKELLENIVYSNNVTRMSNDALSSRIQDLSFQINQIMENRLNSSNTIEEKTVLIKQQAAVIARKKDSLAEKYSQLKLQVHEVESRLRHKQRKLVEVVGDGREVLKDSEKFQEYVNKIKTRSNIYKRYRNDIAALKAENGILSRTLNVLQTKAYKLNVDLSNLFLSLPTTDSYFDGKSSENSHNILGLITQLTANIAVKKDNIIPLINKLKPLQEEIKILSKVHEENKKLYDRTDITLNTNLIKFANEVNQLQEEYTKVVLENNLLERNTHIAEVNLKCAKDEFQATISKKQSTSLLRDRLNHKLAECEKIGKLLKEEQKQIRETEKKCIEKKNAWSIIKQIIQSKINYLQREKEEMSNFMLAERGTETLVLP